ncbi:hypothetical protein [Sporosarcina sp. ITBMC105]
MNAQRKKIIMAEIHYWKQNKLLPEHYCDFLLTLYTQGEEQAVDVNDAILVKEKKSETASLLGIVFFVSLIGASLFFLNTIPLVTISVAILSTIVLLMVAKRLFQHQSINRSIVYILSALLVLGVSVKIWLLFFEGQNVLLIILLSLNCVLWLLAGKFFRLVYFTLSGTVGLAFIVGFYVMKLL